MKTDFSAHAAFFDYDKDGDLDAYILNNDGKDDLFIGSGGGDFYNEMAPLTDSYYLQNETGFEASEFREFFENAAVIRECDFDKDGDLDYLLGNWGGNTKLKASQEYPMKMYYSDFDGNGSTETIVVIEKNGDYYPLEGLDELSAQMVSLRKKFTTYKSFVGKSISQISDQKALKSSKVLEVSTLQSGYLQNNGGKYSFVPFTTELQVAPIRAFLEYDFDKDGSTEILAAGNYFGIKPYHGRLDSFSGALIKNENDVILGNKIGLELQFKSVRHLNIIHLNARPYLLVTYNNAQAQVYDLGE